MNVTSDLPARFRLLRGGTALAAAALTATVLTACGGTTTTTTAAPSTSPAVSSAVADGSATSSSGDVGTTAAAAHNDADVMFAQMMIVHHEGAIEMADLAADRAASQQVKDLAARIKAAQAPEITQMTGWLTAWGMPVMSESTSGSMEGMDHGGHDMGVSTSAAGMPGMMSEQDMAALEAASGAEFDRLFLQQMIAHHQGAIDMSATEIADGANPDAIALARTISSTQQAEISEMQGLLNAG